MVVESLKIKNKSPIGVDICYIGYVLEPDDDISSISPLYLVVRHLFGRVEKIQGSSDRYLVVDENNKEVIKVFDKLWKFIKDGINRLIKRNDKITFGNADNKNK